MGIFEKITAKALMTVALLDITKVLLFPKLSILMWVCILMGLDFVTGIIKARVLKEPITSEKARRSLIKFIQYFGCIGLVVVMINQNHENKTFVSVMEWAKDGVTMLILYIEILSIFENLYAMDKTSPLSLYVIQPIYNLLSLIVKNNPLRKAAAEAEKNKQDPLGKKDSTA